MSDVLRFLLDGLDRGDGWTSRAGDAVRWHFSDLALELSASADGPPATVLAKVVVVEDVDAAPGLFELLHDFNAHSVGCSWWWDPSSRAVVCSASAVTTVENWWWTALLQGLLPFMTTAAESLANEIIEVSGGRRAQRAHPTRGLRPAADAFIAGAVLQFRDLSAGLPPWLSLYEGARVEAALGVLDARRHHVSASPVEVRIGDQDGRVTTVLREHLHPQYGWGWQLTVFAAPGSDLSDIPPDAVTVMLNGVQAAAGGSRLGSWIWTADLGLVHHTFLPGLQVELLLKDAGPTSGDLIALLVLQLEESARYVPDADLGMRGVTSDECAELELVHLKTGVMGRSYLDAATTDSHGDEPWSLAPRHLSICNFGIFNPSGPTISSLEVSAEPAPDGSMRWLLHHVLRHPLSPMTTEVGVAPDWPSLAPLIERVLRDPDAAVLGSGPEWLQVHRFPDAVFAGLSSFARSQPAVDWRGEADSLMHHAWDPWARIAATEPSAAWTDWPADRDDVECWLEALQDSDVVSGHRAFMRSACEGASAYVASSFDPATAQRTADGISELVTERLKAEDEYLADKSGQPG